MKNLIKILGFIIEPLVWLNKRLTHAVFATGLVLYSLAYWLLEKSIIAVILVAYSLYNYTYAQGIAMLFIVFTFFLYLTDEV